MNDQHDRWQRVGEAITARMAEMPMSQADLCRKSGVSDITVRRLMRGTVEGTPRAAVLGRVAAALGWTTDSIDRILAGEPPEFLATDTKARLDELESLIVEMQVELRRLIRVESEVREELHRTTLGEDSALPYAAEGGTGNTRPTISRPSHRPLPPVDDSEDT